MMRTLVVAYAVALGVTLPLGTSACVFACTAGLAWLVEPWLFDHRP